jgi:hypothetical protein
MSWIMATSQQHTFLSIFPRVHLVLIFHCTHYTVHIHSVVVNKPQKLCPQTWDRIVDARRKVPKRVSNHNDRSSRQVGSSFISPWTDGTNVTWIFPVQRIIYLKDETQKILQRANNWTTIKFNHNQRWIYIVAGMVWNKTPTKNFHIIPIFHYHIPRVLITWSTLGSWLCIDAT